jgi:hypothetical protein
MAFHLPDMLTISDLEAFSSTVDRTVDDDIEALSDNEIEELLIAEGIEDFEIEILKSQGFPMTDIARQLAGDAVLLMH